MFSLPSQNAGKVFRIVNCKQIYLREVPALRGQLITQVEKVGQTSFKNDTGFRAIFYLRKATTARQKSIICYNG